MSEEQKIGQSYSVQSKPDKNQAKADTINQVEGSNASVQNKADKYTPLNQSQSKKWQKIISEQTEDESTPFILKQQSFQSQNQTQQFNRQKSMMQQTSKTGRQLLIQKKYSQASKQLSKTLMAFQFIAKNHAQTIPKEILKQIMVQTVLPAYNNLALCHLKLKNFQLVLSFTNQILAQDDGNIKARYRRALAFKQLKNTDHAIKDFQIVKKLDSEMALDCDEKIKECKLLEIEIRKKRKAAAQKFISGYQSEDIQIRSQQAKVPTQFFSTQKETKQARQRFSLMGWIKEKCQKFSTMIRKPSPNSSEAGKKDQ